MYDRTLLPPSLNAAAMQHQQQGLGNSFSGIQNPHDSTRSTESPVRGYNVNSPRVLFVGNLSV